MVSLMTDLQHLPSKSHWKRCLKYEIPTTSSLHMALSKLSGLSLCVRKTHLRDIPLTLVFRTRWYMNSFSPTSCIVTASALPRCPHRTTASLSRGLDTSGYGTSHDAMEAFSVAANIFSAIHITTEILKRLNDFRSTMDGLPRALKHSALSFPRLSTLSSSSGNLSRMEGFQTTARKRLGLSSRTLSSR
jgi:hypothetical protein